MNEGVLNAVTAAKGLGGDVSAVILSTSSEADQILPQVKKIQGLKKVYVGKDEKYAHSMAEVLAPALSSFLSSNSTITHLLAPHTSPTKNLLPRLSGLLSVSSIADIISISSPSPGTTEYTRPIYAGNALLKIRTQEGKDKVGIVSVRTTGFDKAPLSETEDSGIEVVEVKAAQTEGEEMMKFLEEELTVSSRPELASAGRVVSGGRALKSMEQFNGVMEPLADSLGAAIGASRAAVDAGYADNSLQVGQTGKVVAPELYLAVGISGAIQHLAGMKESKMIVAINKDADAPIFQVADYGLVADLFTSVPDLVEKINAAKA